MNRWMLVPGLECVTGAACHVSRCVMLVSGLETSPESWSRAKSCVDPLTSLNASARRSVVPGRQTGGAASAGVGPAGVALTGRPATPSAGRLRRPTDSPPACKAGLTSVSDETSTSRRNVHRLPRPRTLGTVLYHPSTRATHARVGHDCDPVEPECPGACAAGVS